jgi:hypothetical protein
MIFRVLKFFDSTGKPAKLKIINKKKKNFSISSIEGKRIGKMEIKDFLTYSIIPIHLLT